ncbi:MAG: outer membrane protein assembly factor BamA, partial [Acidobacteria bacterium]|nr:outer membrane protein assembly factor BamA [Acidobacteriota bacterium]
VTVEGRVSGGFSEVESGPIDVTVNLNGTIDRFTPTVTSDPPASDITLFSLLGFGSLLGSSNRNGATASPNASLVGQSLLYQSLGSLIGQKILPFADSFTYDPGLLDTSADPGPKVSFERRVTSDIRLLVIYNLKDNRSRAVVEWQVNPDWTVQFTSDEIRKEYRAEARFRRRYQGHWTWGGRGQPVTLAASLGPITGEVAPQAPATTPPTATPPAPPSTEVPSDGARIVSIGYRADAGFDTSILRQYLQLAAGQPLAIRAVQSSIKSLFATGDFRDIRVESEPVAGGVAVTFVLSLNYRIGDLTFDGLRGTTRDRAERLLTLRSGDVLSLNGVDRGATAIQELLNRTGYLEAAVDPETVFDRNASRANVIFHVITGPRAKVAGVNLEGNVAPFTADELIKRMKGGPGQHFRVYMARDDAERMRAYMARKSYRKADVGFLGQTYDAATKTVTLRYKAVSGPVVKVEVAGVPPGEVKRLLPFHGDQGYSEDVVETAADDIVKSYQERGFYNASVDSEGMLVGNIWTTTFRIDRGEQFHLDAVKFTGNSKIPDDKLRAVVATAPQGGIKSLLSSLFRRPTGPTRTQLSSDRDAVESYYRLNGFNDAQVATPVVNTDAATHAMTVDFPVVEGPQTIVTAVKIEGNEQVPGKDLPKPLLHPGDPLNPATLRQDLVALQTFYADRGNAEVQITPRPEISTDKTKAAVTYVVAEGPKIKVDQVIVRGNSYTKTNVILRESQLDAGDPFSYRGLLETQRDLYRLGTFQRVEVQAEQAGTSVADRNVVISVEEGKALTVAGSVGATKASETRLSPLLSASIAHRNLFGTGRYLGLETIFSRARQEAFLTFREPFILGYNVPVQLTVFQSDEHRRGAHIRQRGTFIEASKVARYQTRWSIRYEYRISDCLVETANDLCDQVKSSIVPGLDPSVADIQISSITPTFFWDRRDDPLNPHRGFFSSASVEYAFPIAAAKASFTKEFAQTSYYLPLTARTTLAMSGRVGLIQPRGKDEHDNPLPVPFSERFTAGGESTHRAYALDLLGTLCRDPRDPKGCVPTLIRLTDPVSGKEGPPLPIGGNALLLANVEYRFPIFSALGGAAFVDIGNVYANNTIDFGDLRYGVGTGLRYLSPVGPLRFDVAYKLNRRIIGFDSTGKAEYEKPLGYVITLGYAF